MCFVRGTIVGAFAGERGVCGCHVGNIRGSRGRVISGLRVNFLKRGLGKRRLGLDLSDSSGVSWSKFSNCEIMWYTVIIELVSEIMPDEVLSWGDSNGGKAG